MVTEACSHDPKLRMARHGLVVTLPGEVVGYTVGWSFGADSESGTFAVDARYRGSKIGERVLTAFLKQLKSRDTEAIYLEVRRSNLAARNLYGSRGFRVSGVRKHYYADNKDDVLLMTLSLTEGEDHGLVQAS